MFGSGNWSSTAAAGQCDPATRGAPAGCSWRMVQEVKRASKTCADVSIGRYVEASDERKCFESCGAADRTNSSSPCWINCFFSTMLGPNSTTVIPSPGGIPIEALFEAWRRPFESDEAAQGGCPAT